LEVLEQERKKQHAHIVNIKGAQTRFIVSNELTLEERKTICIGLRAVLVDHFSKCIETPCVVLVINGNPYGLMVAMSYMCRSCP
jgi:hypothetical protein